MVMALFTVGRDGRLVNVLVLVAVLIASVKEPTRSHIMEKRFI